MATWERAVEKIKEGLSVRRADWPSCKSIRTWLGSDADYFAELNFDTTAVIIQDCPMSCSCSIAIWQKNDEDINADDWIVLRKDNASVSEILYAEKLNEE